MLTCEFTHGARSARAISLADLPPKRNAAHHRGLIWGFGGNLGTWAGGYLGGGYLGGLVIGPARGSAKVAPQDQGCRAALIIALAAPNFGKSGASVEPACRGVVFVDFEKHCADGPAR